MAGTRPRDPWKSPAAILAVLFLLAPAAARAGGRGPVKVSSLDLSVAPKLAARELAVKLKEKDLARRERDLAEAEKLVREKLERLSALQKKVEAELAELKQITDKNFKKLIKTYSAMSPSRVAPLIDAMDDARAVRILRAMKPGLVAKILPKLNRDKAVRLSLSLGLLDRRR
jgi:flagellar motility protein MotE (MotC chaperone)